MLFGERDHRVFPFADRIIHMDERRITRVDANVEREAA
jgi:hypothetical protein